ncbi:unnamed protein product [Penicillium roqueforti FM164]|uniref:Genomic scaffold, ProqFM164S02 n=1 Tax=Penicillium roqueforti (strain FM164) TaxID=1365484 RepID=W6Q8R2_PENRF|nr:unnamed protein product [Penicillium roqueforti FM164]
MRDPRCLRMTFDVFPEVEKGAGMLMFCLASWQMSVPLQTIRLLAQVHLQGEGDANSPIQILSHALCPFHMSTIDDKLPEGTNREDRIGAQVSLQLQDTTSQKAIAVTSIRDWLKYDLSLPRHSRSQPGILDCLLVQISQ